MYLGPVQDDHIPFLHKGQYENLQVSFTFSAYIVKSLLLYKPKPQLSYAYLGFRKKDLGWHKHTKDTMHTRKVR